MQINLIKKRISITLSICLILALGGCASNAYYVSDSFGYTTTPQVAKRTVKTTVTTTTFSNEDGGSNFSRNDNEYLPEDHNLGDIFERTTTTTETETIVNNYFYNEPLVHNYPT
jgi:ABC-type Fe3+-hydroxamate transport system substrate-binding protein